MFICYCFECHRKCLTPFSLFLSCCVFVIGKLQLRRQSQFNARKKFQYAILCVRAMVRLKRLRYTLEPLRMEDSLRDPYRVKVLRKVNKSFHFTYLNNSILSFSSWLGNRWMCFPCVRPLGEKRRRSKSCCAFRKYTAHRIAFNLFGESQPMKTNEQHNVTVQCAVSFILSGGCAKQPTHTKSKRKRLNTIIVNYFIFCFLMLMVVYHLIEIRLVNLEKKNKRMFFLIKNDECSTYA